jgi:hypothetical protein
MPFHVSNSQEEMAAKLRELDGDLGLLLEPDREEVVLGTL